ncbi:MAG: asparagine synthase [Kosmotogaceae bacterium]|nr:asparagine synthase [Kosmotogaceae bacterium]
MGSRLHKIVDSLTDERIALSFSGGVDSSLLAKLCKDAGKDVFLFTVGFEKEFDIEAARKASELLGMPIFFEELPIEQVELTIKELLPIVKYKKFAGLNTAIGFYHVIHLVNESDIKHLISANGADELFCGYNNFLELYPDEKAIKSYAEETIEVAISDREQVKKIAKRFGMAYDVPFLEKSFVEFAKNIPVELKMVSKEDKLRKKVWRRFALESGLPEELAFRPKKAFQYSSGVMNAVKRLSKKRGFKSMEEYIQSLKE